MAESKAPARDAATKPALSPAPPNVPLAQTEKDVLTKPLHVRIAALETALRAILLDPYGCTQCDSGKLRGHKPHWVECGYAKAEEALKA